MKKEIIISNNNYRRIRQEIDNVQAKCTARIIFAHDIFRAIDKIELKYENFKKKDLEGCKFDIDMNAQDFPGAYRFNPESTWFKVEKRGGKWRLLDVYRGTTAAAGEGFNAELTEEIKEKILKKYEVF